MKILRNVVFVMIGAVLVWSGDLRAYPDQACDIYCAWGGSSCCMVGDMGCGEELGGSGVCGYCNQGAGCFCQRNLAPQ